MSAPKGVREARILAEAYNAAPINWLRSYGRIDNRVRGSLANASDKALEDLAAIPEPKRCATWYGAEQALIGMLRVAAGTDPRGGSERDQMVSAMGTVAREMARALTVTIDDTPVFHG